MLQKMAKFILVLCAAVVGVLGAPNSGRLLRIDPTLDWRIVGGAPAPDGVFGYQISMRYGGGGHFCGGSIIDQTTILTAAHCVDGTSAYDIHVVAGTTKLDEGGTRYDVSDIRAHEDYDANTLLNDIAMLKLASPIEYTSEIYPVELATEDIGGDENVILSGWGTTSFPGSAPNDLQFIWLKTLTVDDCRERQGGYPPIEQSQICTFTQVGEGACHGDSGGPLVHENLKQAGVVSWGRPCAIGQPDVFTRVSFYNDWIKRNLY